MAISENSPQTANTPTSTTGRNQRDNNNNNNNNNSSNNNSRANSTRDDFVRRPFIYVLQEWVAAQRAQLDGTKSAQSPMSRQQASVVSPRRDSNFPQSSQQEQTQDQQQQQQQQSTVQDWEREMARETSTSATEKFIYVCKRVASEANDDDTCTMLKNLLVEYPNTNWIKITDSQQSNCTLIHMLAQRNKVRCIDLLLNTALESITHRTTSTSPSQSHHHSNNSAMAYEKERKMMHRLLEASDSISATPLLYATSHNADDAVAYLLSKEVNTNVKDIYNKFPLLLALRHKNYKIAEMLLADRSTNIHLRGTKGNTALHTVVEEGDLESCKFLVEHGASAQRRNNDEENVLFFALPHHEVAYYLGQHYSKNGLGKMLLTVNTSGQNIFHKVANDGFFDSLIVLLSFIGLGELSSKQISSLLNTTDRTGHTPLLAAIKAGRRDLVRFLCKCEETNLNDGDRYFNTPLYYAASSKDHMMASLLTRFGASLKASNRAEDLKESTCLSSVSDRIRSLSTVLTLMLSAFAIVCIVSVAVVCIIFFATNISSSAADLRKKAFGEVTDFVENSFHNLATAQVTAVAQIKGKVDVLDEWDAFRFTYTVYKANYRDGDILAASSIRLYNGASAGVSINSITNDTTKSTGYVSYENPLTFHLWIYDLATTEWDDLPHRPVTINITKPVVWHWITNSATKTETYWSTPYLKAPLVYLFYSLITPLRHENGTYLGYYALDASVQTINEYLKKKAKENYDSTIAIIETKTQYLVASSVHDEKVYTTNPNSDGVNINRFTGVSSSHSKTAGMAKQIQKLYGTASLENAIKPGQRKFHMWTLGAERQALNMGRITDQYGLDWIVIQTLPTKIFYQTFGISIGVMAGLTVILLVLGIILSTIAARLFMRPILILIKQAEDIKMLQLDKVEKDLSQSSSSFTEIKTLQESYKSMTARLKQFRQFIPGHILSVIDEEIGLKEKKTDAPVPSIDGSNNVGSSTPDKFSDGVSVTSAANTSGMISRALKSSLNSGCISILTIHLPNLEEILEQYSAEDLVETTKALVSSIRKCVQESSGQLVSMSKKKVIVVWNTFIAQSDHRFRACKTASEIMIELEALKKEWMAHGLPQLDLSIGVASGTAYYGNIGSDSTKFFTILGRPSKQSDIICRMNKEWETKILIGEDVQEHIKDDFFTRPIGNRFEDALVMYELGPSKTPDAWVEELAQDNKDIWKKYTDGFHLFTRELFVEAMISFNAYNNENPNDPVTLKMMDLCNELNQFSATKSDHDVMSQLTEAA